MSLKWLWPLLLVTTPSWADANFDGQVRTLGIDKVDIVAAESVPAWMQRGLEIQAFGWPAQVQAVHGDVVTLKLGIGKLRNAKVGDPVSIRAPADELPQHQDTRSISTHKQPQIKRPPLERWPFL